MMHKSEHFSIVSDFELALIQATQIWQQMSPQMVMKVDWSLTGTCFVLQSGSNVCHISIILCKLLCIAWPENKNSSLWLPVLATCMPDNGKCIIDRSGMKESMS